MDVALLASINMAPSSSVMNLSVLFTQNLSVDTQVKHVSRSAFYHLLSPMLKLSTLRPKVMQKD